MTTKKKILSKKTKIESKHISTTKIEDINFNNVRISYTNKQIIMNNIIDYIVNSIEDDTQYSSYFELKKKVGQFITDKVNELMTPENIKTLSLFGIGVYKTDKHNPCIIQKLQNYYDEMIPYNIGIGYFNQISELDSGIIKLDCNIDKLFEYNIKTFEVIKKSYLTDEIKEDIQMLLKQHYDIFCELQLVYEEYKNRIFKFKKGNTLLKKYPGYKKFLVGVEETDVKKVATSNLVDQFESCNK